MRTGEIKDDVRLSRNVVRTPVLPFELLDEYTEDCCAPAMFA